MDQLDPTAEKLLSTTRSVRHRLDADRPVELWRRGLGQGDSPMSTDDQRRANAKPGTHHRDEILHWDHG